MINVGGKLHVVVGGDDGDDDTMLPLPFHPVASLAFYDIYYSNRFVYIIH